ncbi:DUF6094 domain-containing protein [Paenibacillus polymyxa]|uniref:DUF6094 domain-containing protein n=1 Tax=Paenibacillus polymyxa TaxID=1406 RepID=UPI000589E546|nr:DUF6094 domain-containing protein [Paenibacillus polymyxa]AJE54271.1 hypothetical protein RE92_25120 [Paenibacillus polymyxa]
MEMKSMFNRIINNKKRMGNYETDEIDLQCLRTLMEYPTDPFSVADFCAGSGRALEMLCEASSAVSFGIEPNEEKYLELRERADRALFGGYEECRLTRDFYRVMYLNPPYDHDSDTEERKAERKEKLFLHQLLPYLSVGGILIYNIPSYRLDKSIATMLSTHLSDIRMYKSHDKTFQQIYVIGRRKSTKFIDMSEVQRLLHFVNEGLDTLDRLPMSKMPLYRVLAGSVNPKFFRSNHFDVDQLRKIHQSSSLVRNGIEWTTPKRPAAKLQPLLPDKEMHRILRMASGKLNGIVGSGPLLHVLKGTVQKIVVEGETEENEYEIITREKEIFIITFKLIDRYGNIKVIQG